MYTYTSKARVSCCFHRSFFSFLCHTRCPNVFLGTKRVSTNINLPLPLVPTLLDDECMYTIELLPYCLRVRTYTHHKAEYAFLRPPPPPHSYLLTHTHTHICTRNMLIHLAHSFRVDSCVNFDVNDFDVMHFAMMPTKVVAKDGLMDGHRRSGLLLIIYVWSYVWMWIV